MMWTSRLRRHGGLQNIQATRARQEALLNRARARCPRECKARETKLRELAGWMIDHPLRTLNGFEERFVTDKRNRALEAM